MNHDSYDPAYIRAILLGVKTIAMVGASANNARPSYFVLKYLASRGYTMLPVNPGLAGGEIAGIRVYASLAQAPGPIDMVDIFRKSDAAGGVVDEALALDTLPKLLDQIGFRRGLLVGHSDGASIAAIYAGSHQDHRVEGIALIAPHFIVEDISVASIAEIKTAYETGGLREKLARWHKDVDNAFYGWNAAWLDPKFRDWDISEVLAYIRVPTAILQGVDDVYGTMRQIEIAQEECYCPVDVTVIPGAGHQPHREAPGATLDAISEFANAVLRVHGSQGRAA